MEEPRKFDFSYKLLLCILTQIQQDKDLLSTKVPFKSADDLKAATKSHQSTQHRYTHSKHQEKHVSTNHEEHLERHTTKHSLTPVHKPEVEQTREQNKTTLISTDPTYTPKPLISTTDTALQPEAPQNKHKHTHEEAKSSSDLALPHVEHETRDKNKHQERKHHRHRNGSNATESVQKVEYVSTSVQEQAQIEPLPSDDFLAGLYAKLRILTLTERHALVTAEILSTEEYYVSKLQVIVNVGI